MEEAAEDMNRLADDAKDEDEDREDFEMHMEEVIGLVRLVSSGSERDLEVDVNLKEGAL